jgi:hypothetical protein
VVQFLRLETGVQPNLPNTRWNGQERCFKIDQEKGQIITQSDSICDSHVSFEFLFWQLPNDGPQFLPPSGTDEILQCSKNIIPHESETDRRGDLHALCLRPASHKPRRRSSITVKTPKSDGGSPWDPRVTCRGFGGRTYCKTGGKKEEQI